MAYLTGRSGSMQFANAADASTTAAVLKVRNWSLDVQAQTSPVTALGDVGQRVIPTLRTATGSAQIFYYLKEASDAAGSKTASDIISQLVRTADPSEADSVCFQLNLSSGKYVKFNAWITGVQLGQTTGEVTSVSVSFAMDGDFIATTV